MTQAPTQDVVVQTAHGAVRGVVVDGLARFRGIPFAAPPFGADRLRFPRRAESWDGVRDALEFGAGVPQPPNAPDPLAAFFNPAVKGEDCLNLNIWSPDVATASLPVMVWIHGGGYMAGGNAGLGYDGRAFARDGVVHVGINYRLGIDGFTYFGEGTDNLGLRDSIAALEWVQQNIGAFGGDPGSVTIFGESGGAVSVMNLLAMPATQGLFVRAIAQSGSPYGAVAPDDALEVTARIAERLGIPATREAFAALPLDRTIAEVEGMGLDWLDIGRWGARTFMVSPFRAVYGTESMPEPVIAGSRHSSVPLLTGTVRNETVGFVQALGVGTQEAADTLLPLLGVDDSILAAYREGRGLSTPFEQFEASWTDWAFRIPTLNLANARDAAPTHVYEFHWGSPALPAGLGSGHALEVPFVQDTLDDFGSFHEAGRLMLGEHPPQQLAAKMHRAWIDFATSGDPGWAAYEEPARTTMVFDTESAVVDDAAGADRRAWAGRR